MHFITAAKDCLQQLRYSTSYTQTLHTLQSHTAAGGPCHSQALEIPSQNWEFQRVHPSTGKEDSNCAQTGPSLTRGQQTN